MSEIEWILLIAGIIYVCLMAVAFKFPKTRENWTKERKESLQILMSATVFLMLFFALWYISSVVDWPDALVIIVWSCAFTFVGLILVSIFAPRGVKLRLEKKKNPGIPDEEE